MKRSLLLGGDSPPQIKTFVGWLVTTWLPVVMMLVAIAVESTHAFSSDNTSRWMRATYQLFAGQVTDQKWAVVHHILRKTGHFTGYGLLGLAFMRGWLIFWWTYLRQTTRGKLQILGFIMAIFCTMLVASLDELHQSFMKDRTGVVSDVLLDTAGAFVMLTLCLAAARIHRGMTLSE